MLAISGEFDARTAPEAHAKLDGILEHLRKQIVINVSGMEIVTSTAISFLIDAAKRTRKLGGDAVLSQPPRLLLSSLKSLGAGEHFATFDSDDAALEHFRHVAKRAESQQEADTADEGQRPWWRFGR